MTTSNSSPATGIRNPGKPDRWLVRPWPTQASFSEIVQHFVRAYVWGLQGNTNVADQLAYFEGYLTALKAARTHELTYPAAWQWRAELLGCIAQCVATFSANCGGEIPHAEDTVRALHVAAQPSYGTAWAS